MTREHKINALEAIRAGGGIITPLLGEVWEMWTGTDRDPGIFTNEAMSN